MLQIWGAAATNRIHQWNCLVFGRKRPGGNRADIFRIAILHPSGRGHRGQYFHNTLEDVVVGRHVGQPQATIEHFRPALAARVAIDDAVLPTDGSALERPAEAHRNMIIGNAEGWRGQAQTEMLASSSSRRQVMSQR